jgi:tRNA dimethylallyltransferase
MEKIENGNDQKKIIFILGPTGSGKTKISIGLGLTLNGEIINSDAFGLYKSADIMTAKANQSEQKLIKHHLIDILSINADEYKILNYQKDCLRVIKEIQDKGSIPVVVGGTNYYVNEIIFDKMSNIMEESVFDEAINLAEDIIKEGSLEEILKIMEEVKSLIAENINSIDTSDKVEDYLSKLDNKVLYRTLKYVDPKYYDFLHENNKRTILSALTYYFLKGKKKSDKLMKEKIRLRFESSYIIYLNPKDFTILEIRIKKRVAEMLDEGLAEIFQILYYFYSYKFNLDLNKFDFTVGVLQAIGYKEFFPLFQHTVLLEKDLLCQILEFSNQGKNEEIKQIIVNNPKLEDLFNLCKERLITATIKYAKSQKKFIEKRILPFVPPSKIYQVTIEEFAAEKFEIYTNKCKDFVISNLISTEIGEIQEKINKMSTWEKYSCEICKLKNINGETEYQSHLQSRQHKKRKSKINKIPKV